jgi:chromosome segregation protein
MYLKNLTLLGFKSFSDKTSLNFQPGVTAIVGPNGCGKSNVSDAIRWVLGEQSAKALRGGEMADVIFTGTDGRKPMGMAEVSLTLGDMDQDHLRASGVEVAYNEATITRRIFRDGNSEYFINRTGCRLKDIQQLFMGTGVGRTSYSILAQGHITQILSSKPEDRRMIFEEAAGITKYKSQKKESLRKLEYTDQNLLRIADLIREVKAADRVAPAPGRQGAPLQTNFPGTPAPRHPARAPSIRRAGGRDHREAGHRRTAAR